MCTEPGATAILPLNIPFQQSRDVTKISWSSNLTILDYDDEKYSFGSDKLIIYGVESSDIRGYKCLVHGLEDGNTVVKNVQVHLQEDCELTLIKVFLVCSSDHTLMF